MRKKPITPAYEVFEDEVDDFDLSESSETVLIEEIEQAIDELAAKGLIVDSGRRRWSPRTGRYEIAWVAALGKKPKLL